MSQSVKVTTIARVHRVPAVDELRGATAVVTGAGSGIGRALALACAGAGMRVAAADVEADALATTGALLREAGATAIAVPTDVTDPAALRALADAVDAELGGADLLCNNAGVFTGGSIWEQPLADYRWVMDVNFYGILHGIQAFVPGMIERGRPAHVVNTISAAGVFPSAFSAPYTVAKFAGFALTECLAAELQVAGAPIGVTVLCPGAVHTAIATSARNRPDAPGPRTAATEFVDQALEDTTARGRPPEEIAALVLDAVRAGRFLRFTDDSYAAALRVRTDELLAGGLPVLPPFV
jgi:NAD(P)-dependent dehydrogenase (short-subunit alcohol dehydrogenase family)